MRRIAVVAVLLTLAVVAAGCASGSVKALPAPPKVRTPPTTSQFPDFSYAAISEVKGTTTTSPVELRPGAARISGRVVAGGAPAGGARVKVERLVGDKAASTEVTAGPDGNYSVDGVLGGRFRLRAYRPPDAAMTQAQVIFVGATEQRSLELNLDRFGGGLDVKGSLAPDPPSLGANASLTVTVTSRGVDQSGTARSNPVPNLALVLVTAGGRIISSPNPSVTNTAGRAQWNIRCAALENQGLSVSLPDGANFPVNVSTCRIPPPTTTTDPTQTVPPEPSQPPPAPEPG